MYALNLAEDGRVLSVTLSEYAGKNNAIVDSFPEDDLINYLYRDGEFIYDPLPKPEQIEEETLEDRVGELEEALNMILTGVTE